ncbi:MAG TPA: hypothetical protein VGT02_02985 [Methylomirabilota bacterium]|jgi:hypothetical protein|nr:hypothetical protein [Methylomirabilota bacterium]
MSPRAAVVAGVMVDAADSVTYATPLRLAKSDKMKDLLRKHGAGE